MNPDVAVATMTAVAAVVVFYLAWRQWHDHQEWLRKQDQQDLLRQIQRDLLSQQSVILARCAELQRRLDSHHRILRYVSRRLS
jgi:hypothetical protein